MVVTATTDFIWISNGWIVLKPCTGWILAVIYLECC